MAKILWDTNLFIYLFEQHPVFGERVLSVRRSMKQRGDQLFATSMTVGEILVLPTKLRNAAVQKSYLDFFSSGAVTILNFDLKAAPHYARIRQERSIPPPDAIQLACGAAHEIDLFITNDDRLVGKVVQGVKFISSLQQAPI